MRGNGRVYRRGRLWWIAYWHRGREFRQSSRSAERKDAEALLRHKMREIGADRLGLKPFVGPVQDRVLVGELLDALERQYRLAEGRALASFRSHLKAIREAIGFRRAVSLTEEDIENYIERCLREGKAAATVNRETQLLGQALRLAVRRRLLSACPAIARLPERNVRHGFVEPGDFEALAAALPEHLQDMVRFAYATGMRRGEILSLTWADVDQDRTMLWVRPEASKTGRGRCLPLADEVKDVIERRWAARRVLTPEGATLAHFIFHQDGARIGDFRRAWKAACEEAGLQGLLFHDLRRSAIRNLVRAGNHERVVMGISGHRTRAVFDRYNIVSERDLGEAMERSSAYVEGRKVEGTVIPLAGGAGEMAGVPSRTEHGQNTDKKRGSATVRAANPL